MRSALFGSPRITGPSVAVDFASPSNQWFPVSRRSFETPARPSNCFACGKFGHWRSECVQGARGSKGNQDSRWLSSEYQSKRDFSFDISPADSVGIDVDDFLDEHRGFGLELDTPVPSSDFLKLSVKGRLFKSMEFWQSIGTLDFIKEGYKIPFISTPPPKHYSNNASAFREADFVDRAIAELLADNRVEELSSRPAILNPLTVSVQTSRKKRLILDLRHINLHVCIPFVMSFQSTLLFFLSILSLDITMLTFFLSIAHFWLSLGTLARV